MFASKSSTLALSLVLIILGGSVLPSIASAPKPRFPPLSPLVRADLERRDPNEYQLFHKQEHSGNISARSVVSGGISQCRTQGCFAFTFDDGPSINHRKVADEIASIGARATFFVVGNMGKCIYDEDSVQALRYSYNAGHQICSHTWSHPNIETLSRPAIDQQVQLVEEAMFKILGVVPACIRPPYGSASPSTIQYLNQKHNLNVITWNAYIRDADGAPADFSINQYRSLHAPQNVIILNHETVPTTSNRVIPQALQIVRQNGYRPRNMGTVAQTVGFAPYKVIGRPGVRDSSWTCAGKPGGRGW
ncbi:unnamed protein product [Tilletia caries]|nr:unnamed protein product [Tilletia caries]CAD6960410.1 unnamed protein product [Tilletia caries]